MTFNLPYYLDKTILSYLQGRTFEATFQTATSFRHGMWAGVAKDDLIYPTLSSLQVNDMPSPSHHVELALYADDMAIIATSCNLVLPVSYMEAYLSDLERWLRA
jgi:hypothetical protein